MLHIFPIVCDQELVAYVHAARIGLAVMCFALYFASYCGLERDNALCSVLYTHTYMNEMAPRGTCGLPLL